MAQIECFEPIVDTNCHILILGTVPGETSLLKKEYYGSPNNYFWDIIFRIFKPNWNSFDFVTDSISYKSKRELLLNNGIALWDVIKSCEREGSSDKNIKNEVLNDFQKFFTKYGSIQTIIFNGKGSGRISGPKLFHGTFEDFGINKRIHRLNSTSSQNPNNPFMILNEWYSTLKA